MRFTQEANVQLFGDRNVAMQYIGLARKLLGELQTYNHDLSPITREGSTSRTHKTPDGALIQVIWFPWQPVIKIFPPGWRLGAGRDRGDGRDRPCAVERPIHHWPFDSDINDAGSVGGWDNYQERSGSTPTFEGPPPEYVPGVVKHAVRTRPVNGSDIGFYSYFDDKKVDLTLWALSYHFNLEWVLDKATATNPSYDGSGWVGVFNAYSDQVAPWAYTNFFTLIERTVSGAFSVTATVEGQRGATYRYFSDEATRSIVLNKWVHIATVCDGATTEFYFDGEPWFTSPESTVFPGWYFLGPWPGSFYQFNEPIEIPMSMLLDDWAVWDKPLRADQIKQLAAGTPASELCV